VLKAEFKHRLQIGKAQAQVWVRGAKVAKVQEWSRWGRLAEVSMRSSTLFRSPLSESSKPKIVWTVLLCHQVVTKKNRAILHSTHQTTFLGRAMLSLQTTYQRNKAQKCKQTLILISEQEEVTSEPRIKTPFS